MAGELMAAAVMRKAGIVRESEVETGGDDLPRGRSKALEGLSHMEYSARSKPS